MPIRVGLISDTHGLLRPEAAAFLRGSELIVHGGDIGGADVLAQLARIAPVIAVRGNNDTGAWAVHLKDAEFVPVDGVLLHVIHDRSQIDRDDLHGRGVQAVVYGHSHKPLIEKLDGFLFVNPGSAGPKRFKLPVGVGELTVENGTVQARIVELDGARPTTAR